MKPRPMPASARHCVVLVTVPDRDTARAIARAALGERLCACAQVVPGLESHYWWEGRLEASEELLVVFKTRRALLPALERAVARLHPYKVPQFVAVPVAAGSKAYLGWIDAETGAGRRRTPPVRSRASGARGRA